MISLFGRLNDNVKHSRNDIVKLKNELNIRANSLNFFYEKLQSIMRGANSKESSKSLQLISSAINKVKDATFQTDGAISALEKWSNTETSSSSSGNAFFSTLPTCLKPKCRAIKH